ncbi:unnamed protein product [Blepharisma stoltei]|uniref:Uncharacterized protein n=1 Tax=Blepharisma stoltei TaxID=1481888 RepID=A0AAU9ISZ7_9CILI|nr:unnamed protein product [Blepharisma stoltei]
MYLQLFPRASSIFLSKSDRILLLELGDLFIKLTTILHNAALSQKKLSIYFPVNKLNTFKGKAPEFKSIGRFAPSFLLISLLINSSSNNFLSLSGSSFKI